MQIAIEKGRKTRPDIKLGICYVSSSPYRVPVARLAAAQAAKRK